MKRTTRLLTVWIAFSVSFSALAAKKDSVSQDAQPSLKTDMSFEDLVVTGKYQFADEAIAAVEEDKTLDDLLTLRNDFKDRLRKETKRK